MARPEAKFCPKCGLELPGEGAFCPGCGYNFKELEGAARALTAADAAQHAAPAAAQHAAAGDGKPKGKLSKGAIGAIVAAVVVIAVAIGAFVFMDMQKKAHDQELYDLAHQTYVVAMSMEVPGWDEAASTPIPMQVDGTDFEGNAVHQAYLYGAGQDPLMLMRGNYTVAVTSGPINQDGGIYSVATGPIVIHVGDDEVEGTLAEEGRDDLVGSAEAPGDAVLEPAFKLDPVDPLNATDEMIAAIKQALLDAGWPAADVDTFAQKAAESHQAAVQAEEERKAAERAAKKAEFQNTLAILNSDDFTSITGKPSSSASTDYERKRVEGFKNLASSIVNYLGTIMAPEEHAALVNEQASFAAQTSAGAEAEMKRYRDSGGGAGNGMYHAGIGYEGKQYDARCRQLIDMIP